MRKLMCLLLLIATFVNIGKSQNGKSIFKSKGDSISPRRDSSLMQDEINTNLSTNIPVISIDDNDISTVGGQNVSSALTASRDPFLYAASFNFFISRFRVRGYDAGNSSVFMNGVPIENLETNSGTIGTLSGLTFILRSREYSSGIRPLSYGFGGIGTNVNIDARPMDMRKRTEIGYSYSDRLYTHRYSFTYSSGLSKKGWAYILSGSRRWSDEGYVAGTYVNSWSYFIGIDKKINDKRTLSLAIIGTPGETGAQKTVVKEADSLLNTHYYNPDWGYQNGKKRNANVYKTNQPYIILTDETKFNNNSSLINAASLSFGDRGSTALDYFNAPNPYPDYYRNLPSYANSPAEASYVAQQWKSNVNVRQINWQRLYEVNRTNLETITNATINGSTGQTYTGNRSAYILGENVTNSQKANFSSTYNTRFGNHTNFSVGAVFISQNDHIYKKVDDLLGGQYYVDLNQYAVGSFPSNPLVQYPNLATQNNIVKTGDKYDHDYNAHINKSEVWTQGVFKLDNIDFFAAAQFSNTQFWRIGNWQNGLYPNNSLGKSAVYNFNNYALKGGATYKLNGKNYLYINAAYLTKAPDFRNVFLSPNTRDQVQNNITNETVASVEGGYVVNTPTLRLKLSGYYTTYKNQMNVISFFNEDYYTYTNYALNNISKVHFGGELGFEQKLTPQVTLLGAASIGRYYYDSRQYATIVNDNTQGTLGNDTIYSKNYRVPNTPQEAYSLSLQYHSKQYWYVGITGNYFDQLWANFNPVRLTSYAVANPPYRSATWYNTISQERLPGEFILDISGGKSWKLPRNFLGRTSFFLLSANINNLTNNKNLVTSGGQQLRFATDNINEFPSKYAYAEGLTYAISATLRF